ncbi:hypothetical protein FJY84_03910 [Candidatus Bathyarchaeota archaeon]|nr:hypothetical protein [Candidatus Bathyarchaeota archaeon]
MSLELKDWGSFKDIGKGYGFNIEGKFHSLLETKKGSYRGNHSHPNEQYTIILSGKAKYLFSINGKIFEKELEKGKIFKMDAKIPHIMIPENDIITFEWWDGDFIADDIDSVFKDYTDSRIGPDKIKKG